MNRRTLLAAVLLAVLLAAVAFVTATAPHDPLGALPRERAGADPASAHEDRVARGGYLVKTMGCMDCHVPWKMFEDGPGPDLSRGLSGHPEALAITSPAPTLPAPWVFSAAGTNTAWSGPWGVSFTANLTPDDETGIGTWTAETFRAAIRTGRHLGRGRPILPPMPWPMYRNLTDADLDAVFAYLKSRPAVRNRVPEPLPPAPAPVVAAAPSAG
jgi:hypothetical protein